MLSISWKVNEKTLRMHKGCKIFSWVIKPETNEWFRWWSFSPKFLFYVSFYHMLLVQVVLSHTLRCVHQGTTHGPRCPRTSNVVMKSTLPPNKKSGYKIICRGRKLSFFPMSSESTSPEWNTRTIFYRVGDTEMMRIKGQIGPFFHFLKSCTVVYRGYIFWYGSHCCLLAKQKQKVVSCVSFSNLLLRFLSIHAAMLYFSDLNDYEIRGELCQWGPVVIVFHLTWELWMLWLWRRCTYPHLVTHVTSSLSDGAHSSLRRCAIHASGGVSGAVTEGLWGTNTSLLYFRSWSGIWGQTFEAGFSRVCLPVGTDGSHLSAQEVTWWCHVGLMWPITPSPLSGTLLICYESYCWEISISLKTVSMGNSGWRFALH